MRQCPPFWRISLSGRIVCFFVFLFFLSLPHLAFWMAHRPQEHLAGNGPAAPASAMRGGAAVRRWTQVWGNGRLHVSANGWFRVSHLVTAPLQTTGPRWPRAFTSLLSFPVPLFLCLSHRHRKSRRLSTTWVKVNNSSFNHPPFQHLNLIYLGFQALACHLLPSPFLFIPGSFYYPSRHGVNFQISSQSF